jgi:hypothetical protein
LTLLSFCFSSFQERLSQAIQALLTKDKEIKVLNTTLEQVLEQKSQLETDLARYQVCFAAVLILFSLLHGSLPVSSSFTHRPSVPQTSC